MSHRMINQSFKILPQQTQAFKKKKCGGVDLFAASRKPFIFNLIKYHTFFSFTFPYLSSAFFPCLFFSLSFPGWSFSYNLHTNSQPYSPFILPDLFSPILSLFSPSLPLPARLSSVPILTLVLLTSAPSHSAVVFHHTHFLLFVSPLIPTCLIRYLKYHIGWNSTDHLCSLGDIRAN